MAVRIPLLTSPDKNAGVPEAYKRFERLGLIHKILRDGRRDRYNHFLSRGFPEWRGTGYFYHRYRPGLVFVAVFLVLLSVGVQLVAQTLAWRKDKARLDQLRRSAYALAWGAWYQTPADAVKSTKPRTRPTQKKVRVPLAGFTDMPAAPSASAIAEGRVNWDEEGEKIHKVLSTPVRSAPDESPRLLDVMVYADGSMAALEPASLEWIPLEPMKDEDAPSLRTSWPVTLVRSLLAPSRPRPEEAVAEEDTDAAATTPVLTPPASGSVKKSTARQRKVNAKKI